MSTPPIHPNNSIQTSTSHNDSPARALCKKIIKLVATLFLTIITLGMYLVWKYCAPSLFPCISTKKPPTSDTTSDAIFIFDPQGKLIKMPQHIVMDSLEFMHELDKHALQPTAAQRFTPFGSINPSFLATYPQSVSKIYGSALSRLQELATSNVDEQKAIAQACLSQIAYLNENYYLVTVPGDHSCFFRSYAISWLCSLEQQQQTNKDAFEQEIQKLLHLPFAHSSQRNALLTKQAVRVLQKCQECSSVNQMYNEVILSPDTIQPLLLYLKQLAFHAADLQKTEVLGEENLRSMLFSQVKEDRLLFERAVAHFLGRSYSSHLSMEFMLTRAQVFDNAIQECLFLLEFIPKCLLTQRQLAHLPDEQQAQKQLQFTLSSFLTLLDFDIRQLFSSDQVNSLLLNDPVMHQQFKAFSSHWATQFSHLSFSAPTLFYLFLRAHPYYLLNPANHTFVQSITEVLQTIIGSDASLAEFLYLSPEVTTAYNKMLCSCKIQAFSIDLLEAFLQTPLRFISPSSSPLLDSPDLPSVRKLYEKFLQCLANISLSQANKALLNESVQIFYETAHTQLVAQITNFKNNLTLLCPIDTMASPEIVQSLTLFLFFLQHPQQLEQIADSSQISTICSIFMPYLQNSMRQPGLLPVSLLAQICGDLCAIDLPAIDQNVNSLFKQILSLMFENLHAANILQTVFHLPSLFGHRIPSNEEANGLIEEVSAALPEAWANHVGGTKVLSPLLNLNSSHQTLGSSFLLISFLMQNPELIENTPSSLNIRLNTVVTQVQQLIEDHVNSLSVIHKEMLLLRYTALYPIYRRLRHSVIVGNSSERTTLTDSFLNALILRSIEQMELEQLLDLSHRIFYQAEDEHVSAISSTLGNLSLCQSLQDHQFTNHPEQILSLSETHGFLTLDFLPENQGTVFVLKENNHYSALLPKDRRIDTEETEETNENDEQAQESLSSKET